MVSSIKHRRNIFSGIARKIFAALLLSLLPAQVGAQAAPATFKLDDGTEIPLRAYSARGATLVLWLACDEGRGTREARASWGLAANGVEAWLPDFLGGHFLPVAPSSMAQISGEEVAALIDMALAATTKKIFLISAGRGAVPTLRGIRAWQEKHPGSTNPAGVILFYPELYADTPVPGAEAEYHEIVKQTRIPLFIYQGERSPGRWWLSHLRAALESGGSRVHTELLPKVRGYFYVRQEPTPEEEAMSQSLPELILKAIKTLETSPGALP